jgi:predicted small secreted protein
MMMNWTFKKIGLVASGLLVSLALVGCEEKGPAQKAGESIDKAGKDLKNSVDPRGPAGKLGDKIDNAVGK